VQEIIILHILIHPNGTYGKCVFSPYISNMVWTHQQFAIAKKDIPDPVLEREIFQDSTKKLLLYKTELSEDYFRQFLWAEHANVACSFYTFVNTTLKFLMCFIVIQLHYNKCNCVCGRIQK